MASEGQTSGEDLLVAWANEQDGWVRAITADVLANRAPLTSAALERAFDAFLTEKRLVNREASKFPALAPRSRANDAGDDLRILRLFNVRGVNALAADQVIEPNRSLTVLFGENAVGKTGYSRVFKRVAAARAAEEILGDIHGKTHATPPSATIEYDLSGRKHLLEWTNQRGLPPFTRMSVFDARSVHLHVDSDLAYIFTPGELALFRHVFSAIEGVRARLEEEREKRVPKGNPFLRLFARDRAIYPMIEALGAATDVKELKALASVGDNPEEALSRARNAVDSLKSKNIEARMQIAKTDRDLHRKIQDIANVAASFDWDNYDAAVGSLRAAEQRRIETTEKAFAGTGIPSVLGPTWTSFINAGEEYLAHLERDDYPRKEDACIYCRQPLGAAAAELVRAYRDFCNNETRHAVDTARQEVARLSRPLLDLEIQRTLDEIASRLQAVPESERLPAVLALAAELFPPIVSLQARVRDAQEVEAGDTAAAVGALREQAEAAFKDLDELVGRFAREANAREELLQQELERLHELENRLALRKHLDAIGEHVEQAKWLDRTAKIGRRFRALLRSLTEQAKTAGEQLLNQDFERHFRKECDALRTPKVQLDFAGRRGETARKKYLKAEHTLSDVLSEGEQKVIALADFLAEVALRRGSAPVVFDDPVTSLDYKRLCYVVDRIVEVSRARQVIVFTHNIWFATELLSRFEKNREACTYYSITDANGRHGVVTPGRHPRWDTVKKMTGRINELLQHAAKATGETQAALIESAYGLIRSWCEVVVEQEMLAGVTQRYQPNVVMTKLPEIRADRLPAIRDVILPLFEKACRVMPDHSQPLETLHVRPTLDELRQDWSGAQHARAAYVQRSS